MFKFPKMKRSLVLTLALLLSFSLFGCTAEELETAGEIIGTVAEIAESVTNDSTDSSTAEDSEGDITDLPVEEESETPETEEPVAQPIEPEAPAEKNEPEVESEPEAEEEELPAIDYDGIYTTKEDVALYLWTYGELPYNFMTKSEARKLGWPGGGLDAYAQDMCIGGDTFGNREGLLPQKYKYIECDIDTLNQDDRGPKRIVFSEDCEVIYYTPDHYESFELLYGEE